MKCGIKAENIIAKIENGNAHRKKVVTIRKQRGDTQVIEGQ